VAHLVLDDRRRALHPGTGVRPAVFGRALGTSLAAIAALTRGIVAPPRDGAAGALFAGVAVHAMAPLSSAAASGTGALLGTLGHAGGWPVPVGGSQALTDALLAELRAHG